MKSDKEIVTMANNLTKILMVKQYSTIEAYAVIEIVRGNLDHSSDQVRKIAMYKKPQVKT